MTAVGPIAPRPTDHPTVGSPSTSVIPAGIRRGTIYFPELEALRGVAIALVFAFHADGFLGIQNRANTWPALPLAVVSSGHTGVTLFFVLSGFLLALPFFTEAYGGRRVSRPEFCVRRALRILPLFYAAVLVATVLTAHELADLRHAIPWLTFLASKPALATSMAPYDGAWWSLVTEVQFYAVLPLVALAFGRSRALTVALIVGYGLSWVAVQLGWVGPALTVQVRSLSLVGRGPLFLCGILAAWLYHQRGEALRARLAANRWLRGGIADVVLLIALIAFASFLRWKLYRAAALADWAVVLLVPDGAFWTVVLILLLLFPLRTKVLWSNPLLRWLGVISYSIYLVHLPLIVLSLHRMRRVVAHGYSWNPSTMLWLVLVTLACVGISTLTYRFIERPFLLRKARGVSKASGGERSDNSPMLDAGGEERARFVPG